jgi:5-methylthioadenosine/S-adenosylhomocysteine deaminase
MESILLKGPWVAGAGIADVGVRDGKIVLVGTAVAEDCYDRVIPAADCALIPGLVNCHGHAAMTLFRGIADDLPLMPWLEERIWPLEARLTADCVYWGSMLAIAEMIRGGTTTFTDMYFFEEQTARAAAETGMRAVLSRGIVAGPNMQNSLAESRQLAEDWHGAAGGRITIQLGPHALYTCPPATLAPVLDLAAELGLALQIHLAETRGEVEESLTRYGKSPVAVLEEAGFFQLPVLAAHGVHISQEDIGILARRDVRVSHNPASNLKLGSGIAPVPDLLSQGVTVGLGTDGAASNNNLDMLLELRLAALIHKGIHNDPTLVPAAAALEMATSMGARALFLEDVGSIREGMKADLILVDLNKAHFSPRHNPEAAIAYAAHASDVALVMADGQILLEGGRLTTIDEERVIFEAQRCIRAIKG